MEVGANGAARSAASVTASDGSARPVPVSLPPLFFRALCQDPKCHALLGGFHTLQRGMIVFRCCQCQRTSVFRIDEFGIRAVLAGPLVERRNGEHRRGERGGRGR